MTTSRLLDALVGDDAIAALFTDAADIGAMLRVEAALAEAEAEAGLVALEAAERIAAVCRALKPDLPELAAGLARDGVLVPTLVTQLRAAVGPPHAVAVHVGATSQDIVDTSLVMRLGEAVSILKFRLQGLVRAIEELQAREGGKRLMAHTRMQAALPFTVADKLETWAAPLVRHAARLDEIAPRLLVVQLGGPVGTRAELGDAAGRVVAGLARRLGLAPAAPWHTARDALAELCGWLSLLTGALGKIGQDTALMVQTEVGAAALAGGGTSSAMAHKQNPVPAEVLVALARFNAGLLGTLHQGLVHENERSGAAWTLEWLVLPEMVVAAGAALRTAASLLSNLSFP